MKFSSMRGMSLPEASIILMVLSVLTSVLAPSVADYVNDARMTKVKEDCEAIGTTVARTIRDVGACLRKNGAMPCTKANRVDLIFSSGPQVATSDVAATAAPFGGADIASAPYNWSSDAGANADSMESQFVTNGPAYATPADNGSFTLTGPQTGLGWRGAYLSGPVGPDPWGKRYLVNSAFLAPSTDGTQAGWTQDVFCISAGPNGQFQTPIAAGSGTARTGDDFVYVISGGTR